MPFVLSDTNVCQRSVPVRWKPVLLGLAEFFKLERELRERPKDKSLTDRINQIHNQLIAGSNDLLEPNALDDLTPEAVHQIFARSVFLTMRIAQSVVGDDQILDTASCRTLELYQADFLSNELADQQMRAAMLQILDLDQAELQRIEDEVQRDVQQSTKKHKLVRAIRNHFNLWEGSNDLRENVFAFFAAIYPDTGLVQEEVDIIVSGTMIFFCLPFEKEGLTTDRFKRLPPEQQQKTSDFIKRVNRFSQWQFAHFPVFGFRRGEDLDSKLVDDLANNSGLSRAEVLEEISTLTAIIPTTELDKYVVHDIFGHSWQACMLDFDSLYRQLATYADPLDLSESAKLQTTAEASGSSSTINAKVAGEISFQSCFVGSGTELKLDEGLFRKFVESEVAERLPAAMTPVLAEILADVAEYKLIDVNSTSMANSSAFDKFPAKLDLTMRDILYYFRQATKVFRLWSNQPRRHQRTIDQLVSAGASKSAAENAVGRALSLWRELESDRFAAELRFHEVDGELRANVACRLALNFLAIHRETLRVYKRLGAMDMGRLPMKGLRDLMLISVAVFFEQAPSRNLWRVDEFLTYQIEPLCEQLAMSRQP